MAEREPLLDALWRLVGCDYLSDLGRSHCARAVAAVLAVTPPSDYAPSEWQDLHTYVVGEDAIGESAEEIRGSILRHLRGK